MKSRIFAVLMFACAAVAQRAPGPSAELATGIALREVRFEGNIQLPRSERDRLAKTLKSKTFEGPHWLDDVAQLARYLWQDNGYFKAQIKAAVEQLPDNNGAHQFDVTFNVEEGAQYRLGALRFKNNHAFADGELYPLMDWSPGEIFNRSKVSNGLQSLRKAYGRRGYINFTSVPDTNIDDALRTISLTIDMEEGAQFRVRNIEFTDLPPDLAVTLRARLSMKPGDIYNSAELEEFFLQNSSLLPAGSRPEINSEIQVENKAHVVDLKFVFADAGGPPQ